MNIQRKSFLAAAAAMAALAALTIAPVAAVGQGMGQPRDTTPPPPNAGDMPMGPMAPTEPMAAAGDLRPADRSFVMGAARGGLEEVELGRLATERALDPDVKGFGQRMVDDHSKANEQLRSTVAGKGVSLPASTDRKARADYDRLAKLSGAEFDRAYVKMMVKDHVEDVADFNHAASNAGDPDVRRFASTTLPTLREHLKMAQDLESKVDRPSRGRAGR